MKPKDSCKSFRKTSTAKGRQGRKRYKTPAKLNNFKNAKNEDKQKGKMRMYICEPLQDAKPLFSPARMQLLTTEKRLSTTPVKNIKLGFTHICGVLLSLCKNKRPIKAGHTHISNAKPCFVLLEGVKQSKRPTRPAECAEALEAQALSQRPCRK